MVSKYRVNLYLFIRIILIVNSKNTIKIILIKFSFPYQIIIVLLSLLLLIINKYSPILLFKRTSVKYMLKSLI